MVGTSGSKAQRRVPVNASALSLPVFNCCNTVGVGGTNSDCISPAINALTAGAPPL